MVSDTTNGLINTLLLFLLLSPLATSIYLTLRDRNLVSYLLWYFVTATILSYLWVLLAVVFLIVPMHFLVTAYLPYPISLLNESPYKYWLSIPLFIVFNELSLTVLGCLISSWWLIKYLRPEWRLAFQKKYANG
jgi:hypothetical protein